MFDRDVRWFLPKLWAAALVVAATSTGCTRDQSIQAGLPDDLASQPNEAAASAQRPASELAFDGYYRGVVGSAGPVRAPCTDVARSIARDMLVVDGRATFGVNLPLTALVARTGDISLQYLDVGTLQGRFADGHFTGTLQSDADPACHWAVSMERVAGPVPGFAAVRPEPVDIQPEHGRDWVSGPGSPAP